MRVLQIINTIFTSNTYLLQEDGANWCWLIDVGDVDPILNVLIKDVDIRGIFLTHTHYDHIYGINKLVKVFPSCVVYTSEAGKEGLYSDKLNFSRYHDDPILFAEKNLQILHSDDKIELFPGIYFTVMETPGHDRSCLTYYTDDKVFTGDSFIPGLKIIATFPRSNKQDAIRSAQWIQDVAEGCDLYPGHGDVFFDYHASE